MLDGRAYVLVPRKTWEAMTHRGSRKVIAAKIAPAADGTYGIEAVRSSLASKMIARRKAAGLTQAQLARLARVRVETISRLENAMHMPGVRTFDRIDRALKRTSKKRAA